VLALVSPVACCLRLHSHNPLTQHASPLGSVDGHALQIDELKGTQPTAKIDLSGKKLGVASAIIIASCIKENGVLKELKYAAARVLAFLSAPADTEANTRAQSAPQQGHKAPLEPLTQLGDALGGVGALAIVTNAAELVTVQAVKVVLGR